MKVIYWLLKVNFVKYPYNKYGGSCNNVYRLLFLFK